MGLMDGFDLQGNDFCADCGREIYTANYGGMFNGVYLCKRCAELSDDDKYDDEDRYAEDFEREDEEGNWL